jgi:hypothetical protein
MYASGKYPDGFGEPKNPFAYENTSENCARWSMFGDTSADAFITVPVVVFPLMRPRWTPSEGLK